MYAYHASSDACSACTYNACIYIYIYAKHICLYYIVLYGLGTELTTVICQDNSSAPLSLANSSTTTNAYTALTNTTTATEDIIINHDNQTYTE